MCSEPPVVHTPKLPFFKHIPLCKTSDASIRGVTLQRSKSPVVSIFFVFILALMLISCSGNGNGSSSSPSISQTAIPIGSSGNNTTASTSPGIAPGPQTCPDAVKAPAHWDAIIPTQNGVTHVEKVICGYLIGTTTLQVLVTVRYQGTGQLLDVYVYNDITSPGPLQLFKLQSLYDGDARISAYNTVLTAEVDQYSSINAGKSDAQMSRDLFREFQWSDGAGTLVPVSFPGIFPDLTRYQAEVDQIQVNQGHDTWKLNAAEVARNLATDTHLLSWPVGTQAVIVSGGGSNNSDAVVTVKNPAPPGDMIRVTLERLERNTNQGIWEVVAVTANDISITTPQSRDILTSPMNVAGTGNAFEGVIGTVDVLDHVYTPIGHAQVTGATSNGNTTFSTMVSYDSTFKGGKQDGIVVLYAANNAGSSIGAAVMIKELLG